MAILGSEDFDVTEVIPTSLWFGKDEPFVTKASPAHDLADPDVYNDHLQDVNGDDWMDLVCHFRTQDTGIDAGDESAVLIGRLRDCAHTRIVGRDEIRAVPPK